MKKVLSLFLSLIMIISVVMSTTVAYSAQTATDKLQSIQTQAGFVPGQPSIVSHNCYGFISKVCELLYGVEYKEGLISSYQVKQSTGNFETKGTYTTTKTAPDTQFVNDIYTFFMTYGSAGDVFHYGSLTEKGQTHTCMIQSIDSEKMQVYHSNYGSDNCRIDTIYWDSFKKNPSSNIYSGGSLYSLNSLLTGKMKTSGLGISISHFKNYDNLYSKDPFATEEETTTEPAVDDISLLDVTGLAITKEACNSISFVWDEVELATSYRISVHNHTKGTDFGKTVTEAGTSISNLDPGNVYTIKVCAIVGNTEGNYCQEVYAASKPKKEAIKSIYSSGSKKIYLGWKKLSGSCTGYQIQLSTNKSFSSGVVTKTITSKDKLNYTRKSLKSGKIYYARVRAYTLCNGTKKYGTWSAVKSVKCR